MSEEAVGEVRSDLWDVEQAAAYLKMSVHWVYKASADGRLPVIKRGRKSAFRKADLDAWLKKNTRGGE